MNSDMGSAEGFRKHSFLNTARLISWLIKIYDPTIVVNEDIDSDEAKVDFVVQFVSIIAAREDIQMNPKYILLSNELAAHEILKFACFLFDCFRTAFQDFSAESKNADTYSDEMATADTGYLKQEANDLVDIGRQLYTSFNNEPRHAAERTSALRFLENITGNLYFSQEQKMLRDQLESLLQETQETLESVEKNCIDLENDRKTLIARIKKRSEELERTAQRLKMLENVRPQFMDEFEALETNLASMFTVYVEKSRNIDYLKKELSDLQNTRRTIEERKFSKTKKISQQITAQDESINLAGSLDGSEDAFNADLEESRAVVDSNNSSESIAIGSELEEDIATATLSDDVEFGDDDELEANGDTSGSDGDF